MRLCEVAEERDWGTEVKVDRGVGDRNIPRGFGWGPWILGLLFCRSCPIYEWGFRSRLDFVSSYFRTSLVEQ
jgi:hypothetical protein